MFVTVKDRGRQELEDGATAKDLAEALNLRAPNEAVGVTINGELSEVDHSKARPSPCSG